MGKLSAVGTIVALVVGAGMLGLPFVIVRSGFWNGIFQIVFMGLMITLLNLFVGEVVLRTKGRHQLVALAEKYLGGKAKFLMFAAFVLGQYGALIAYLVGVNSVLSGLFGVYGNLLSGFVVVGMVLLLLFRLHIVARAESFLSLLMIFVIIFLCVFIVPEIKFENFSFISDTPLAAYGVALFSFMGFTVIPEVVQELGSDRKSLSRIVMLSFGVIIILYVLFSYAFVGVFGSGVAEVATESLSGVLLFAGSFLTLLLFITSFLAVGVVMKDMFTLDLKFKKFVPWLLTVSVPILVWLVLSPDFIEIISVIGSFTGGLTGILICLMVLKSRKEGNRKPEFIVWGGELLSYLIIVVLLSGMAWQLSVFL